MVKFKKVIKEQTETIYLEDAKTVKVIVEGGHAISVKATADGKMFVSLAGFKEQDFKMYPSISTEGSYVYDVEGYSNLQIGKDAPETKVTVVGV